MRPGARTASVGIVLAAVMLAAGLAACGPADTGLAPGGLRLEYRVVPGDGSNPTVADTEAVAAIMRARIDRTGVVSYRVTPGASGQVTVEMDVKASDDETSAMIRDLLGATGRLQLVPLGTSVPEDGDPVDTDAHPPLLEGGVAGVAISSDQTGQRTLDITFQPGSATLIKRWTTEHVGEVLAVVLDGKIATAPFVMEPISDGRVQISSSHEGGFALADAQRLVAILSAGGYPVPVQEVESNAGS